MAKRLAYIDTGQSKTSLDVISVAEADHHLLSLFNRIKKIEEQIDNTPAGPHRQKQMTALYYRRLAMKQLEARKAELLSQEAEQELEVDPKHGGPTSRM